MGARWYDPSLGRWLSADSIVPEPANPQSLNRLSYVYNNPLRFVDPTGMFTEEELVEMGAYTWEEIEALRGTDWYYLLMDSDAQIGASMYFGNGIANYTGPMGMGTFYMYEGKLIVGGDVSFWSQDKGIYETKKGWASPARWGEMFEQADHEAGSYGLLPRLEGADYTVLNIGFAVPGLVPPVGGAASLARDKNGDFYASLGLGIGEAIPISINYSYGFIDSPNARPEDFLVGSACNVNMGALLGVGYTSSSGGAMTSTEVGWYTPSLGSLASGESV